MQTSIIITNQRTGGTSLTKHLSQFFDATFQEPFNKGRVWEELRINWRDNQAWPQDFFQKFIKQHILIKLCVELHGLAFYTDFIENLIKRQARVVVLTRESEQSRALSLKKALETGVWGPNLTNGYIDLNGAKDLEARSQKTLKINQNISNIIDAAYQGSQIPGRLNVSYEELYSPRNCQKVLQSIYDHFSINIPVTPITATEYLATGKTPY